MSAWNPRYLAYARAQGRTPIEMLEHDDTAWPGGRATGFILWMSARWQEFAKEHGYNLEPASSRRTVLRPEDYEDFDRWLVQRVDDLARP